MQSSIFMKLPFFFVYFRGDQFAVWKVETGPSSPIRLHLSPSVSLETGASREKFLNPGNRRRALRVALSHEMNKHTTTFPS